LRNIAEAAAYYPDASPVKAYLAGKVGFNLQWLDTYANNAATADNPFHVLWLGKRPEGPGVIALWEQNYLAYGIDRAMQLGFAGGRAHRDAIAKFQLRLFTSDPQYQRSCGAPRLVSVGTSSGSGVALYRTMSEIWNATQTNCVPFAGWYGPEARLNIMVGLEAGWPGAQDAYTYLMPFINSDLAQRAGWALDFYPTAGTPPPPPPPPPPTPVAAQITSPAPGATLTSTSQVFTWNAGTGVAAYRLTIGATAGGTNIYNGASTTSLSASVSGLSNDGQMLYVRLFSSIDGVWQSRDYTYRAYLAAGVLPSPWLTRDIGKVGLAGSASYSAGTFTARGAGHDIWGSADAFRFVYRSWRGDGEIVARVVNLENTDPWAKAGVMIRNTDAASAAHASMLITPANGVNFTRRTTAGGSTGPVAAGGAGPRAPYWVRIVRRGSTFIGYVSSDGLTWVQKGSSTISMGNTVLVGLAVTSHNTMVRATATFDSVAVK
jgi:hypothetical protein